MNAEALNSNESLREGLGASIDLMDRNAASRLGISVAEYRARLAKARAEDLRAMEANPILPADDDEHYESRTLATNTGERMRWED
jgi:hypothetical protein